MKFWRFLFLIFIVFSSLSSVNAQDTTWYNSDMQEVDSTMATYYVVKLSDEADTSLHPFISYYINAGLKEKYFKDSKGKVVGLDVEWYKNGQVKDSLRYSIDEFGGKQVTYWPNGVRRRVDLYSQNKFLSGNCWGHDGQDTAHYNMESQAKFPGGIPALMSFLKTHINYPRMAKRHRIQGIVMVRFVVEKDGSISAVKVIQSADSLLDASAINVVKEMPKWTPGKFENEVVRNSFRLPIRYKLR